MIYISWLDLEKHVTFRVSLSKYRICRSPTTAWKSLFYTLVTFPVVIPLSQTPPPPPPRPMQSPIITCMF